MKIYIYNGTIRPYKLLIQNGDQVGNKIIREMETGKIIFNSPSIVKSRGNWFYLAKCSIGLSGQ